VQAVLHGGLQTCGAHTEQRLKQDMHRIFKQGTVWVGALAMGGVLSSCHWVGMESRLAERAGGESDEVRIVSSDCPENTVVEHTTAGGKKIYVQRCRVVTERKTGALFVFGGINKKHFSVGGGKPTGATTTTERHVVIGYRDLALCGIEAPPAEQQHELGTRTMLWDDWKAECDKRNDPSLAIVSSVNLPVSFEGGNDFAAWEIFNSQKKEPTAMDRYVMKPLASVADVPMTVLGSVCYMPYYNVKAWIKGKPAEDGKPTEPAQPAE
jgi:hypothetical protein